MVLSSELLPALQKLMLQLNKPFQTQLWRIQDLHNGGKVYMLEIFIYAIRIHNLSVSGPSKQIVVGTILAITADWGSRESIGTQRALVALLCDVLTTSAHIPKTPEAIATEVTDLAKRVLGSVNCDKALSIIRKFNESKDDTARTEAQKQYDAFVNALRQIG